MRICKIALLFVTLVTLSSCASSYKMINPASLSYNSANESNGVLFEYKYGLLEKKYQKKELKKGVRLVAIKITNNSGRDLTFGGDAKLAFGNASEIQVLDNERVFKTLKQSAASYLWYLLLTPVSFQSTTADSYGEKETNSTPIGLVIGPGLTASNMITVAISNKNFKQELLEYNINGTVIKDGETKYGLIGIQTENFDALKLIID